MATDTQRKNAARRLSLLTTVVCGKKRRKHPGVGCSCSPMLPEGVCQEPLLPSSMVPPPAHQGTSPHIML
ncbi:hypothetical protein GWK47_028429 [Chionoecetes opilio]|uniref:Uncharacterized protein n=1 Tax=Chionoecetes opilio TaxID=41210 RepID=A0A8J5D2G8_CHIOP|nr:hypothetical protein GWK47_028429 [Chionoecetes opilio]